MSKECEQFAIKALQVLDDQFPGEWQDIQNIVEEIRPLERPDLPYFERVQELLFEVCFYKDILYKLNLDNKADLRYDEQHCEVFARLSQTKQERTMNIQLLNDCVLVKQAEPEEKTMNGIIIPNSAKTRPNEGTVVAVGDGKVLDNGQYVAMKVQTGDHVMFAQYSGLEMKYEGEDYILLTESEILAVVQED